MNPCVTFAKKLCSTLFALLVPLVVNAHDFETDGIFYNILSSNEVEVTFKGNNYQTFPSEYDNDVIIPDTVVYEGTVYVVREIGTTAFTNCPITSIAISDSVSIIRSSAFANCEYLRSVEMGANVTTIENAFYNCSRLRSITIPRNVTSIGKSAFEKCTGLTSVIWEAKDCQSAPFEDIRSQITKVIFGDEVDVIPAHLCDNMNKLVEVTIPNGVKRIGEKAFYSCSKLSSISLPPSITSIEQDAFSYCNGLTGVYISNLVSWCDIDFYNKGSNPLLYAKHLYLGGEPVTNVLLAGDSIKSYTFCSCEDLVSIAIPKSVTMIGDYAFYNCINLNSIELNTIEVAPWPKTMSNAYDRLPSVNIPANVVSIGEYAFYGCRSLISVNIPNSITTIEKSSFEYCIKLDSIHLPNSLTSIGESAFSHCESLRSIKMPIQLTSIEYNAFWGCDSLRSVHIEDIAAWCNITIGYNASPSKYADLYSNDTLVTHLVIPEGVRTIANTAFSGYKSITAINIPSSVISIEDYALHNDATIVHVNSTIPPSIYENTFSDKAMLLIVPEGCIETYKKATYWKDFLYIRSSADIAGVIMVDDIRYMLDKNDNTASVIASGEKYSGELTIPATVTNDGVSYRVNSIADNAFKDCTKLTKITVQAEITSIGDAAFASCDKLTSFTIPNTCSEIGEYAFAGCSSLTNIHIPLCVNSIGIGAFQYCKRLTSISIGDGISELKDKLFYQCENLKDVAMKCDIKTIGSSAFQGCKSLSSISIPASVTFIDYSAFRDCESLENIYITDIAAWCNIEFRDFPLEHDRKLYLGNQLVTNLVIPEEVDSIKDCAFYGYTSLESVTIPNSTVYIGYQAFNDCTGLKSVYANKLSEWCKINFVGAQANPLSYAKKLYIADSLVTNVVIPRSAESVDYTFAGCNHIESIKVEEGNPIYDSRNDCNAIIATSSNRLIRGCRKTVIPYGVTAIVGDAFSGCSNFSLTLPNTVESLGVGSFTGCSNLTVTILSNIRESYDNRSFALVFKDCKNLSIVYGGDVTEINSFENCAGLTAITIPSKISYLYSRTFYGCTSLHKVILLGEIYFADALNSFSDKIDTLIVPNIKDISAIRFGSSLKKLNIGSAEVLSSGMLLSSEELRDLTLPFVGVGNRATATERQGLFGELFGQAQSSSKRAITQYYNEGKYATYYIPAHLEKLTLTEGCTELTFGALYGMSTLKEITLPSSLYMVGEKALYGCAGLEHIYCKGASPAACFDNSFNGVRTATCVLHIPYQADELYAHSTGWKAFYNIQAEQPLKVSITHNIQNAGIVVGNTEYTPYSTASLTAIANSSYKFVAWIENGEVVCDSPTYEFPIESDRSLLVVFTPIMNDNNVQVFSSSEQVYFTWDIEEGVAMYTLTIYADAEMTNIVSTIQLDVHGNHARTSSNEQAECLIEDLPPGTSYYYSLLGYTQEGIVISQLTGSFKTEQDDVSIDATNVKQIEVSFNSASQQIVAEGVRTGDSVYMYSTDGTIIHKQISTDTTVMINACRLPRGLYVIRIGNYTKKILIEPH